MASLGLSTAVAGVMQSRPSAPPAGYENPKLVGHACHLSILTERHARQRRSTEWWIIYPAALGIFLVFTTLRRRKN